MHEARRLNASAKSMRDVRTVRTDFAKRHHVGCVAGRHRSHSCMRLHMSDVGQHNLSSIGKQKCVGRHKMDEDGRVGIQQYSASH